MAGMVLGSVAVFVIEREFMKAAAFALVGAALTFFGLIHGESVGIGESPAVAASYLLLSVFLLGIARFTQSADATDPMAMPTNMTAATELD